MVNFLIYLIISVLAGFGMAILLVEKGKDFPIRRYRVILQKFIHDHIGRKWSRVLKCTTCTSFWTTLVVDIILFVISGGTYFFWPLSGAITAGIVWTIIEVLNKDQDINIFINKGDNEETE